jgi:thiol-disulfide isomerase/thioredoxin
VGFKIGQQLQVRHVPSISILDGEGTLRLANAGSLRQPLEYKLDVQGLIARAAAGGSVGTYGQMPRWYPVQEMIGKQCPDFEAPVLGNGEMRRWSAMLDSQKVNVLMFWSVDCPHCRETLPELNEWLKSNSEGINVVGAARVGNDASREKTQEFCEGNGFVFETLVDENRQIMDRFQVVSTPTFVIVGPDGVIDSVVLTGETGLAEKLEAKKKELLGSAATSGT